MSSNNNILKHKLDELSEIPHGYKFQQDLVWQKIEASKQSATYKRRNYFYYAAAALFILLLSIPIKNLFHQENEICYQLATVKLPDFTAENKKEAKQKNQYVSVKKSKVEKMQNEVHRKKSLDNIVYTPTLNIGSKDLEMKKFSLDTQKSKLLVVSQLKNINQSKPKLKVRHLNEIQENNIQPEIAKGDPIIGIRIPL